MDPLTLAHYFTLFPNNGKLAPLRLYFSGDGSLVKPPMDSTLELRQVSDLNYVELINKTLNDRLSGVEQFGLKSNLNLSQDNYAVKTGTSRDYHDSWTVGYTPDFLVLVWLGNAENTALKELSGQSGAGSIWKQSMELLINSPYNKKTPFNFDELASFPINGNLEFGLPNDIPAEHRELLLTPKLILTPHQDDHILYSSLTKVPLRASKPVQWFIDDKFFIDSESAEFPPQKVGSYEVKALDPKSNKSETIVIHIDADNRGDE
jgi:membrane carboxypeptidase/penicillin-binding protein PbpC